MSSRSMKHHSIGEIRICHSCENRNPGFPAKAGIQLLSEVPCFRRDSVWIPPSAPACWSATARKHGNDNLPSLDRSLNLGQIYRAWNGSID